jgi:hypothetical protein
VFHVAGWSSAGGDDGGRDAAFVSSLAFANSATFGASVGRTVALVAVVSGCVCGDEG